MDKLPNLQGQPTPILPRKHVRRIPGSLSSMDLGRGCPYRCSFCTIINVQGRKSRFRSPDDLEKIVRENYSQNIRRFFITDDNFARNRDWEPFRPSDRDAQGGPQFGFTFRSIRCATRSRISSRRQPRQACAVFIGLENINPEISWPPKSARTRSGTTGHAAEMARHNAMTWAGYILGFPDDSRNRSPATSRSSSASCPSTSSNSFS